MAAPSISSATGNVYLDFWYTTSGSGSATASEVVETPIVTGGFNRSGMYYSPVRSTPTHFSGGGTASDGDLYLSGISRSNIDLSVNRPTIYHVSRIQGGSSSNMRFLFALLSGSTGSRQYKVWELSRAIWLTDLISTPNGTGGWIGFFVDPTSDAYQSSVTDLDLSAVNRHEVGFRATANVSSVFMRHGWTAVIPELYLINGEVGDLATLDVFVDLHGTLGSSERFIPVGKALSDLYYILVPLKIGNGNTNAVNFSQDNIALQLGVDTSQLENVISDQFSYSPNHLGLHFDLGSSSTCFFRRNTVTSNLAWRLEIDIDSSLVYLDDYSFDNTVWNNAGSVQLTNYNQSGGAFIGCTEISLDGELENISISSSVGDAAIFLASDALLTNCIIRGSESAGIRIDLSAEASTDLSDSTAFVSNSGTYDILVENTGVVSGNTYSLDISGISSPAENTTTSTQKIYVDDSDATNTYNITTNSTYSSSNVDSAGATVNIIAPSASVTISGLVSGSRLKIYDTGTTDLVDGVNSSGTSFSFETGTATQGYDIYIVKPGYESVLIQNYIYPSGAATLPVFQVEDINYSDTSTDYDLDTSGGSGLGTTTDLWLDTANLEIQLATGNNLLSTTGMPLQDLYSKIIESRYANDSLMPYHDPIVCVNADAGVYELRRGWTLKNSTTRDLLRSGGLAQYSTSNVLEAEWLGVNGLGSLVSTITPYYWQVDSTNPTTTNAINSGQPNQLIQIYGDASNGDFDYRDFFVITTRKQGENISTYDLLAEQSLSSLDPKLYNVVLNTTANPNLTVADTSIDANSDGTADVSPYDGMSITWLTSAAVDDWADATEYDPFDYVEDDSSFWITVEGGTSSGTGVADDSGVTWYEIDRIYDANGGDLSQMTNYLFWAQRQTVDIDAGTGTQKGSTVDSLATTRGSDLVLAPGLWAINFDSSAQNSHFPTQVDGTEYEYPVPPPTITVLGFQPLSDVKIIYAGQTLSILNQTSPPFTYNVGDLLLPVTVTLTITKAGFETYTQGVAIVDSDVSITVAQIPEDSSDTYNSPQVEFQTLMMGDSGFLRVLAGATEALADEVAAVRLANFSESSVKAAWALLVAETVPTSEEITTWQGYLTSTGYSNISFNSETGEVD
jgi:hypothetical protein